MRRCEEMKAEDALNAGFIVTNEPTVCEQHFTIVPLHHSVVSFLPSFKYYQITHLLQRR